MNSSGELLDALKSGLPCGKLFVKLAVTPQERTEIFQLRYKVFNEELNEGLAASAETGLDQDDFDNHCDHLMVLNESKKVIGTYRLLFGPNRPAQGFYSQTEFDFSNLEIDFNQAVELGRGCIEAENRKQTTLMTLFWGLHRYMLGRNARYLLGCGSLPKMSPDDAYATYESVKSRNLVRNDWNILPNAKNILRGKSGWGVPQVPQLIEFYFQFGAKVLCEPAFDSEFGCFDFLLLFDMNHLSEWGSDLLSRFDKRLTKGTNLSGE